jgi:hypothetical protein
VENRLGGGKLETAAAGRSSVSVSRTAESALSKSGTAASGKVPVRLSKWYGQAPYVDHPSIYYNRCKQVALFNHASRPAADDIHLPFPGLDELGICNHYYW